MKWQGGLAICLFLDTGVFIGYSFKFDEFQHGSCKCLNFQSKKYSSSLVRDEFHGTHEKIVNELADDVLEVVFKLQRKPNKNQMNWNDLAWMVGLKRGERVELFLQSEATKAKNSAVTFEQMASQLRVAINDYLNDAYHGRNEVDKILSNGTIICWSRKVRYAKEFSSIHPFTNNYNDSNILLDAHDLALNQGITELDFITTDGNDIKNNEKIILAVLQLKRIRLVTEFT